MRNQDDDIRSVALLQGACPVGTKFRLYRFLFIFNLGNNHQTVNS
jgi:hypothetical protein